MEDKILQKYIKYNRLVTQKAFNILKEGNKIYPTEFELVNKEDTVDDIFLYIVNATVFIYSKYEKEILFDDNGSPAQINLFLCSFPAEWIDLSITEIKKIIKNKKPIK